VKRLLLVPLLLSLLGCATKEYYAAADECSPYAYQKFPPHLVQMYVPRTQAVQVPTGGSHCKSYIDGNETHTRCTPEMRTEYRQYQSLETVDVNEPPRDAEIRNCARLICTKRFGNPDCETPKK
jgi:hypothetical protein